MQRKRFLILSILLVLIFNGRYYDYMHSLEVDWTCILNFIIPFICLFFLFKFLYLELNNEDNKKYKFNYIYLTLSIISEIIFMILIYIKYRNGFVPSLEVKFNLLYYFCALCFYILPILLLIKFFGYKIFDQCIIISIFLIIILNVVVSIFTNLFNPYDNGITNSKRYEFYRAAYIKKHEEMTIFPKKITEDMKNVKFYYNESNGPDTLTGFVFELSYEVDDVSNITEMFERKDGYELKININGNKISYYYRYY